MDYYWLLLIILIAINDWFSLIDIAGIVVAVNVVVLYVNVSRKLNIVHFNWHKIDMKCAFPRCKLIWFVLFFAKKNLISISVEVVWLKPKLSFCLNKFQGNRILLILNTWHKIDIKCPFPIYKLIWVTYFLSIKFLLIISVEVLWLKSKFSFYLNKFQGNWALLM